ncbi:phage tail assembly chaperone [Litorimonas haliclonae]|uniref:phage tail assembly chaperone n=1 Tax=Litorimonas haliclonae TaxID=2081977 RepID=UPI0039EE1EE6
MSEKLNWPFEVWLRLAVLQMGQTPETFWSMEVIDWLTLCKKGEGQGLSLADFEVLQKQFPDKEGTHDGRK